MSKTKSNKFANFYDLIVGNEDLIFVNAKNDTRYSINQIIFPTKKIVEQKRSLVFLYLNTSIESLATYLSFLKTEHTLVLLSDTMGINLKFNLEKKYEPSIIYDGNRDSINNYEIKEVKNSSVKVDFFFNKNLRTKIHKNIKILLSTSGTTGSPKFVKLSSDNILQNALSICKYLPIKSKDVVPINLPLHYSYGLSVLHSNAISGGTIVCGLPDVLDGDFWKYLNIYGFSSIAGVPFVYEMLKRIGFLKKEYPSLKYISQAGGDLSKNIKIEFNNYCIKNGLKFYVMYGQTEATARISYVPPTELEKKITSIGVPIKNGKIVIDNKTSELLYSGPNVFGGYTKVKKDLLKWENILSLKTGDLAYKDADGYYYIKGRLKRIVKVFGYRVNLDEIEAFIKLSLNLSLLACVGVNDQFILIAHGSQDIDKSEIKKKVFETYKIHSSALKFKYFDELPRTKNKKVDYKKIVSVFLEV